MAIGIPRMGENVGRDDGNPIVDPQKKLFARLCILTITALTRSYSWACHQSHPSNHFLII